MIKKEETLTWEFAALVSKLELVEFFGICKVLCVATTKEGKGEDLRDFDEVFSDLIDRFVGLGRKQRREVMQVLRKAKKIK